ncbi:hypothetical protein DM01DRAFT_1407613 [Hesseltinella vesiculosa]|uniref:Uncharacterized protein n=1 Tax=Hesseltinella vesiculosa TaxID=101127 RepID=A0A1X2GHT6_9FUNG|nr:hypothetical protein DM01DRAFT_1407613 [Hesseltinella vesiculosa]
MTSSSPSPLPDEEAIDLDRVYRIAALDPEQLFEHWQLSSTAQTIPDSQPSRSLADDLPDNSEAGATKEASPDSHFPSSIAPLPSMDQHVDDLQQSMQVTQKPPVRRSLRQRNTIQLHPFTLERQHYWQQVGRHIPKGAQRRDDHLDAEIATQASSFDPDNPSLEADDDLIMSDSDNDTFDASKSLSLEDDSPVLHIPGRKRRHLVGLEDSDEDNSASPPAVHLPTHGATGLRKTRVSMDGEKEDDIFSLPPATPFYRPSLDPFGSLQRPPLITYKRHRKRGRLLHSPPSTRTQLFSSTTNPTQLLSPTRLPTLSRLSSPASSRPTPRAQPDQTPFGSAWADLLDDNGHHDIPSSPEDIFDISTLAPKEKPPEPQRLPTTTTTLPAPSLPLHRQATRPSVNTSTERSLAARPPRPSRSRREDDDFIVYDDEESHADRRRNVTLREIRARQKALRGILPRSFTKVYQNELDDEESGRRTPTPASNPATNPAALDSLVAGDDTDDDDALPVAKARRRVRFNLGNDDDDDDEHNKSPSPPGSPQLDGSPLSHLFSSPPASGNSSDILLSSPTLTSSSPPFPRTPSPAPTPGQVLAAKERLVSAVILDAGVNVPPGAICSDAISRLDNADYTALPSADHADINDRYGKEVLGKQGLFGKVISAADVHGDSPHVQDLFYRAFHQVYQVWCQSFHGATIQDPDALVIPLEALATSTNNKESLVDSEPSPSLVQFTRWVSLCLSGYFERVNQDTDMDDSATDDDDATSDSQGGKTKTKALAQLGPFVLKEAQSFFYRVLFLFGYQDLEQAWCTSQPWVRDCPRTRNVLAVLLFAQVEWLFIAQERSIPRPTGTPTLSNALHCLVSYLLSLGPASAKIQCPAHSTIFEVSDALVLETWTLVFRLLRMKPALIPTVEATFASYIKANTAAMSFHDQSEIVWLWIFTLATVQPLAKNDKGILQAMAKDSNCGFQPWSAVDLVIKNGSQYRSAVDRHLQSSASQAESATEILAAIQDDPLSVFKLMLDLRTVFGRCYLLLDRFGWQWQGTTLRLLYDLIQWQPLQRFTPHPSPDDARPLDTASRYFPSFFQNYRGTVPDMQPTDTCGVLFLKWVSLGLSQLVNSILQLTQLNQQLDRLVLTNVTDESLYRKHIKRLNMCISRLCPSYLVVTGAQSSSASRLLSQQVMSDPWTLTDLNSLEKPNPFVEFAYHHSVNITLLHATSKLAKTLHESITKSKIALQSNVELERACAQEITNEVLRIYRSIEYYSSLHYPHSQLLL